jgi:carboxyl-terminal processing protease
MKKIIYVIAAVGIIGAVLGIKAQTLPANHKLRMAEAAVAQFYVDTVNEDKLVEAAIKSMLEELDPHSAYSNAEETRELKSRWRVISPASASASTWHQTHYT